MSRKSFIESQGATCKNWTWSWSFINEKEKVVIFGAWDTNTEGNTTLILDESWEKTESGKKSPGYTEALENIKLLETGKYRLKTFTIIYSNKRKKLNGQGPASIADFVPILLDKYLLKIGTSWYASDGVRSNQLPEEILLPEKYIEGASKIISINTYERNKQARDICIKHYGTKCVICNFNFEEKYGIIGMGIIHVHHLVPLSDIKMGYELDPIKDLRPVCPNCHTIIHSTQPILTIDQVTNQIASMKCDKAKK